ncbi:MAG: FAD-dependent oxidoreductase [Actinomycetota bacterium]
MSDHDESSRTPYPEYDAVVIGGGPAGYTAMIYLANEHLKALCVEGFESGGQIARAARVNNYPGFPTGITGAELPALMREQAENLGGEFAFDQATSVEVTTDGRYIVNGTMDSWKARAVIMATGSTPLTLGLESEERLRNRGVAYCATCDGNFFAGKRVAVVGGGDAAVEQAMTLTNLDCEVIVVHRRREFRAKQSGVAYMEEHESVDLLTPYTVQDILASDDGVVSGIRIENAETGEVHDEPVAAVFVAIGHRPESALVSDLVEVSSIGHVLTEAGSSHTSRPGIFAAGDLVDHSYRQAVTAAGSGCVAAIDAGRWLAKHRRAPAAVRTDSSLH